MAKYNLGFLDDFIGKLGKVVGGKWRGVPYLRTKGPSTRKNDAPGQIEQKAKFKLVVQFARRFAGLFRIGYAAQATKMTPRNVAVRQILKSAITGIYPNYEIDYTKVMVSQGSLEAVNGATLTAAAGLLTWDWEPNIGQNEAEATDLAVVVAYCPSRKQCIYRAYISKRDEGGATLSLTPFVGQLVHTWIFFVDEERKTVSDSIYTGSILMS